MKVAFLFPLTLLLMLLFCPLAEAGHPDAPGSVGQDVVDQLAPTAAQADVGPLDVDVQPVFMTACDAEHVSTIFDRAPGVLRLLCFGDAETSSNLTNTTHTEEGLLATATGRRALGDIAPRLLC